MDKSGLLKFLWLIVSTSAAAQSCATTAQTQAAFETVDVPEDLHITFAPTVGLLVQFPQSSGGRVDLYPGNHISRNETIGPPIFSVCEDTPSENTRYVIVAVDPDVPYPQSPTEAQLRHFLGSDFVPTEPSIQTVDPLVNRTDPVSSWIQPAPPPDSAAHRYIFLLFVQPPDFDKQTLVTPLTPRIHFNVSTFAQDTGLGNPIGGNFMFVSPGPAL